MTTLESLYARRRQLTIEYARHLHETHACQAPRFAGPGCRCLQRSIEVGREIQAKVAADFGVNA